MDRNRPKEQSSLLDNRLPNLTELSYWGAEMCKVFGMIALAGSFAFSFSAYAKEQICEQECAQRCGGKGNACITNGMPPSAQTGSGRRIEVPASFVDPRGINL